MRNRGQIFLGALLLFWGLMALISSVFDVDFGALCWPSALIVLGLLLLVRPRFRLGGVPATLRPLGDVRRWGPWEVQSEEIWTFVGDVRLDLSQADIPPGTTRIAVLGFVGDVNITLPPHAGLLVTTTAFLTDSRILGHKRDSFLTGIRYTSPNYQEAERRLDIELTYFVVDLDVEEASAG